jgi:hypothetical protein
VWEPDPETGFMYARLLGNRYQIIDPPPARPRLDVTTIGGNWRPEALPPGDGVRNVTRSGSVVESPLLRSVNPPTTSPAWAKEKVLILLKLAETINGPQSNVIPGHRHPNMLGEYRNAEAWSRAVAILKASGLCETSKSGTLVTGMLADVINSIERDEVRLSLPPLLPKSSPQK